MAYCHIEILARELKGVGLELGIAHVFKRSSGVLAQTLHIFVKHSYFSFYKTAKLLNILKQTLLEVLFKNSKGCKELRL